MQMTMLNDQKQVGDCGLYEPTTTVTEKGICAQDLWHILEFQKFKCALTGRLLSPDTASVDHIFPISKGGKNEASNLQIVERQVNSSKGTMTQEQFIQMCREVVAWADSGSKK